MGLPGIAIAYMSGPAPYKGMPVCFGQPVETGPMNKGGELLEPPNHTSPQRLTGVWPPYGGVEHLGPRKSTIYSTVNNRGWNDIVLLIILARPTLDFKPHKLL